MLLRQLLEALARESISSYGRDSILNLLVTVVPRKSLQEPNNSLTLWVIDQGEHGGTGGCPTLGVLPSGPH